MSNFGGVDAGADLGRILFDQRIPSKPFTGAQRALVHRIVSPTRLTFTLVDVPGYDFIEVGPAPFPRATSGAPAPPVGTACIVDFVGFGLDRPFVVLFPDFP